MLYQHLVFINICVNKSDVLIKCTPNVLTNASIESYFLGWNDFVVYIPDIRPVSKILHKWLQELRQNIN